MVKGPSGLAILVPTTGEVDARVAAAWFGLDRPPCLWLFFSLRRGTDPAAQRNQMIADTIAANNPAYFLFLDSDVLPPVNLFSVLLGHGKPAVSGVVPTRDSSRSPVIVKENGNGPYMDWKIGDIFDVERVGGACLWVSREAIDAIGPPWFEWGEQEGEDIAFARKIREAGFSITVDTRIQCGHIDGINGPVLWTPQLEKWRSEQPTQEGP